MKALQLSPVKFNHISINIGNTYVSSTDSFQPCKAGLYWFHFDTHFDNLGRTIYTMRDVTTGEDYSSIIANESTKSVRSLSDLRNVTSQAQLQMFSQCKHNLSSNVTFGMTWGGMSIDSISTDPPTAFSVIKQNSYIDDISYIISEKLHYTKDALQFDFIFVNSGQCWNEITDSFTAPTTGIYILNFSTVTTINNAVVSFVIYRNISNLYFQPGREDCYLAGMERNTLRTHSCNAILKLEHGDSVHMKWQEVPPFSNINEWYYQASFKGFLYAPTNQISIVWDARLNIESYNDISKDLVLHDVLVNIGEVFKSNDTSKVFIPKTGVYYVIFKTYRLPSDFAVALFVNGSKTLEITSINSIYDSCERNILLQLAAGTCLSLRSTVNCTNTKCSSELILGIAGFLVLQS